MKIHSNIASWHFLNWIERIGEYWENDGIGIIWENFSFDRIVIIEIIMGTGTVETIDIKEKLYH